MHRQFIRVLALCSLAALGQVFGCSSDDTGTEVSAQKTCEKGAQCVCNQDCTLPCDGGNCQFSCGDSAKCTFTCKGGGCQVSGSGATSLDCSGGGCILACTNKSTCSCTDPTQCLSN